MSAGAKGIRPTGIRHWLAGLWSNRSGSTAVEFGLVLLPFLMFVGGIFEFGRYLWIQNTIEAACETASHYIFAHSTDPVANIQAAMPAQVQAAAFGIQNTAAITVTTSVSVYNGENYITINASYPFTYLGITFLTPTTITVKAVVPVE